MTDAAADLADKLEAYAKRYSGDWASASPTISWDHLGMVVQALRAYRAPEDPSTKSPSGHMVSQKSAEDGPSVTLDCPEGDTRFDLVKENTQLKIRCARLEQSYERGLGYATRLAAYLWEKQWQKASPDWKPLPDLMGVLTQIDNMIASSSLTSNK